MLRNIRDLNGGYLLWFIPWRKSGPVTCEIVVKGGYGFFVIFFVHTDLVDVSDIHGKVKHLRQFPLEYGNDFFYNRETAVLLKIKKGIITYK